MPSITLNNNRQLHYQDQGQGFPVVFGHSYLWDHRMWAPQVAALKKSFRCIVPDLWGHGCSDPLEEDEEISIERLADDYLEFTEKLELKQYALVGLSVGGMWGIQLALKQPKAVRALVVMDSFVGAEPEESRQHYFGMLEMIAQLGSVPPPLAEQIAPIFFSPLTMAERPAMVAAFRETLLAIPPANIPTIVAMGRGIFARNDLMARLCQLQVPTLFMAGKDDLPRPPHEAEQMAAATPGSLLELIADAGHVANLEQPEIVSQEIAAFLDRTL